MRLALSIPRFGTPNNRRAKHDVKMALSSALPSDAWTRACFTTRPPRLWPARMRGLFFYERSVQLSIGCTIWFQLTYACLIPACLDGLEKVPREFHYRLFRLASWKFRVVSVCHNASIADGLGKKVPQPHIGPSLGFPGAEAMPCESNDGDNASVGNQ
jgi:hypothetical protein